MAQDTAFGRGRLITYMKVEKQDGRTLYYKVLDEQMVEINEEEYKENA